MAEAGKDIEVLLTDKFPNPKTVKLWSKSENHKIQYFPEPVDALNFSGDLHGMRTLFEGFHHFKPDQALKILQDVVNKNEVNGIFEVGLKKPFRILILLISPLLTILAYFVLSPYIKPFKLSRIVWTYIIPIVPIITCWDGIVSLLRVYSQEELFTMAEEIGECNFHWEIGSIKTNHPFTTLFLVGYPMVTP
ncbi:MAG: hypothetical protein JXA19_04065 [Anaerolineales bacterium]|nr:hypothetical protein [Anaerolineales bacterium]